jgi:glycosyl transferase family 25
MQTPQGIDAIFVIHAASLAERRKLIEAQLSALRMHHEFILDYDVAAIPDPLRERMFRSGDLSPGQQSCALKHWQAHMLADQRGHERVLVLEDDVILAPDFKQVFERALDEELAIDGPHVTFLGCGGHYYVPKADLEPGRLLYRRDQGKFADSYIVNRSAVKQRLRWLGQYGIEKPIDHQFEHIDREAGTAMYWLEPPIVEQGSHNGQFRSALERSYPLWFQAIQFRWKKLWRRKGRA